MSKLWETLIASVLVEHSLKTGIRDMKIHCWCGWSAEGSGTAIMKHQAEILGSIWLKDQAAAWDEGHHAGVWNATDDSGAPYKDNPYRIEEK